MRNRTDLHDRLNDIKKDIAGYYQGNKKLSSKIIVDLVRMKNDLNITFTYAPVVVLLDDLINLFAKSDQFDLDAEWAESFLYEKIGQLRRKIIEIQIQKL